MKEFENVEISDALWELCQELEYNHADVIYDRLKEIFLEEEVEKPDLIFQLNKKQREILRKWERGLKSSEENREICYVFIPNSIGTGVMVRDSSSGEEINLTDYASW